MSIFDSLKNMVKEDKERPSVFDEHGASPSAIFQGIGRSAKTVAEIPDTAVEFLKKQQDATREVRPTLDPYTFSEIGQDISDSVSAGYHGTPLELQRGADTSNIPSKGLTKAEQVVKAAEVKQIKTLEEELKGMVRGSVDDPKKDSKLMEVVNSVGKGLNSGFDWTADQWKNMTPTSKVTLISALTSAYMLSKGKNVAAGNLAGAALEQQRHQDTLDLAKGKLDYDQKEKTDKAEAAYLKEKKSNLAATATNSAIKSVADSSSFKKLTQEGGLFGYGGGMNEKDRIALANTLASEYRLQVQGGGIKQGSFQDFANNPEVVKATMQKYKPS